MKIIVGLGNPGEKYEGTRHNAGFVFIDRLAAHPEFAPVGDTLSFNHEEKFQASVAKADVEGEKFILVKPQTYMNNSGRAVSAILNFIKGSIDDLIVVSDDIDLPLGYVRIRQNGSSGGQKGLLDIIQSISSDQFTRIRLGVAPMVGKEAEEMSAKPLLDAREFVLSRFSGREKPIFDLAVDHTMSYIVPFLLKKQMIPAHTLQVQYDSE